MKKQIYIDKEALAVLSLAKAELLSPVTRLMNKEEMEQVNRDSMYEGKSFPCPFLLNPSGKRNKEVLKSLKKNEIIDLVTEGEVVGELKVDSTFKIDLDVRIRKLTGGDFSAHDLPSLTARMGDIALCGEYKLLENPQLEYFNRLSTTINSLSAKNITGFFIRAEPLHRVHEKILREALMNTDVLVIFLLKPYKKSFIDYDLRLRCVEFFIDGYLQKERVVVIPIDDTYLYAGQNKMALNAIVAKNYGCTKMITGEHNPGLGVYYKDRQIHSILDELKGIDINFEIISEFVYCDTCRTIVSTKVCPHGHHHHISYNSESFIEFFKLGLLPPAMFVRQQISAIMLSHIFPNRFKKLNRFYYDMMTSKGIVQDAPEEEFYLKLMQLYQTTSLT
ncbi:sulfate adenylyltransferase [Helicobacter sp. 11S02629-2]|uniref:sulfate adenylyltransferase n=1 Tax=Helicobacter sp. 11S02629-2 TaxID=1476195 RepID=UPI000BA527EB|nr:sulfate adenylyltransferase [Helicobacter sp. 11S02629-2]PAF45997.1 sulfate adenylyltransferase [Helicobacter sp. 11S02629-2]